MITIDKPVIKTESDKSSLCSRVFVSNDTALKWLQFSRDTIDLKWRTGDDYPPKNWKENDYTMWFRVPAEYGMYLNDELCDPFLVGMLYYAMVTGSDIECRGNVSEKLLYGIQNHVVPLLCREKTGFKMIRVSANTVSTDYSEKKVNGTGMSCGVDSLHTLLKYSDETMQADYKLGALTYLNMGAVFQYPEGKYSNIKTMADEFSVLDSISYDKYLNAKKVGEETNLPVIYIESNLDKDYYRGCYGYTCVYRNFACVLSMSKYFKKFYCSSAGWPDFYDPILLNGSEHYELLLCSFFSTESVEFILSDEATRFEKTKAIKDYKIAQENLDVCFQFDNCGKCPKCYRTLITLDILNSLDSFKSCFDLNAYKQNRTNAYFWLLKTAQKNSLEDNAIFANDLLERAEKEKRIPLQSRVLYYLTKPVYSISHLLRKNETLSKLINKIR